MEQIFSLTPLIPVFPLVAFVLIIFGANKNNKLSAGIAIGGISLSAIVSLLIVFETIVGGHHAQIEGWSMPLPWLPTGTSVFNLGFAVDGFSAAMLFMVPVVSTLIFIYASEYMEGDSRYARFFAYVSLFVAGMLTLVIADNLLLLFIAWEIMGLCSYLLIGFWFEKESAKKAGLKAFLTTRIGDVLLFSGMLLLFSQLGTLTFREIFEPATLHQLTQNTIWGMPASTVIALLIFGGAVGKSAQFPLHVWLPDAMEGPTPVSAMIHAATMVSGGVYLVARMLPLFAAIESGPALYWVAIIGSITAFFGATIGIAQNDIKRVLAYSTISQLGYMMIGLGLGGFLAGIFHLLTHSFFKALLFLGSGSVIHAMEHGAHHVHDHETDPQDMMNMGGLSNRMKNTYIAYMAGTLALVGIVPFAGFFSKDEILAHAWHLAHGNFSSLPFWAWVAGTLGAFLTALYMGRQIGLVFLGKPRTGLSEHAVEPGKRMTYPLLVLGVFAAFLGFINVPENVPLIGNGWFHHFAGLIHESAGVLDLEALPFNWGLAGFATVVGLTGFFGGIALYKNHKFGQVDPLEKALGPVFTLLKNKYYVDEFYDMVFIQPTIKLATFFAKFDYDWVINPIVNTVGRIGKWLGDFSAEFDKIVIDNFAVLGTGRIFKWMGKELRLTQTGQAQNYLLVIALVSLSMVGVYLFGIGF